MGKEMKMYHVETQEDYDDLMIILEEEGYMWVSGDTPTSKDYWGICGKETIIFLNKWIEGTIIRSNLSNAKRYYRHVHITKHKAKGVEQMEKVVVPQFVADWFEQNKGGLTIYGLLHLFSDNYFLYDGFRRWVEDYNLKEEDAQEMIAKMYLFNNYEVEEKKYHWRKKKEYSFSFEHRPSRNYLNIDENGRLFFSDKAELSLCKTKFTETKVKQLVGEEDFKKLEKVEIAGNEC